MQILSTLTEQLRASTIEAISASAVTFVSGWAEYSGSTIENPELVLGSLQGNLDNTGLDILVGTPTSGNQRQIKFICIHNGDSIQHIIFFCINTGGTQTEFRVTLQPGDTLFYSDTRGWYVLDSNGNTKTSIQHDPLVEVFTRLALSGSTLGRPISVAATATPGTIIHDTGADLEEIFIWATNRTGTSATLTLEWGGTGTSDHMCAALVIPPNSSPILITNGQVLSGSPGRIRAFSGTANSINLSGYANRIT